LGPRISQRIDALHKGPDLAEVGNAVRKMFLNAVLPSDLARAIQKAHRELAVRLRGADPDVAVRSSATTEDLPGASFARQKETFSTSRARWCYWRPASASMHPSSRTGRSATARNKASTTSKWLSPSVCSRCRLGPGRSRGDVHPGH
jgi:hypothetical protein